MNVEKRKRKLGDCEENEEVTLVGGRKVKVLPKRYDNKENCLVFDYTTQCITTLPPDYCLQGWSDDWIICLCTYCENEFSVPPHIEFIPDYCCHCGRKSKLSSSKKGSDGSLDLEFE